MFSCNRLNLGQFKNISAKELRRYISSVTKKGFHLGLVSFEKKKVTSKLPSSDHKS